jgi:hypothetical protein
VLTITIEGDELWDDENEVFTYTDSVVLQFEHSLVSLSKWEARFHKLFLGNEPKTDEEMFGYVEEMLLTPNVESSVLNKLTEEHVRALDAYLNDPMTATTLSNMPPTNSRTSERISSELIYFWMSQYQINKECENWHLNRLFTLIKVHYVKTQKPQKMPRQKNVQSMAELNAARKKQLGTTG